MAKRTEVMEEDAVRDASPGYSEEAGTASAEDVPPGYKRTEVGVIPEGWNVVKLGDLARFTTGPFGTALHKSDYIDGGIPLINPMHIIDGQLSPDRETSISEDAARRLAPYLLRASDIVIGRRGDMGRCAVVGNDQVGWLCGTGSLIIRCSDRNNAIFVQRILTTERVIAAIEDGSVGSTMTNLNQGALSRLQVQLPPMAERRAIATALSDADALIESLDRLIAKKRAIKQAAMQQLLTGQTRLPGFTGEWETKRLGELIELISSGIYGAEKQNGNLIGMPVATTAHIDESDRWNTKEMAVRFFTESQINRFSPREGDLIVVKSSGSAASIQSGKVGFVDREKSGAFIFSNFLMLLRAKSCGALFLYSHLTSDRVKGMLPQLVEASTYPNIRINDYLDIDIPLPPSAEQHAIATVLSDIDAEIEALERRRDKARQIKQGMMQQLLTGRVRLVTPEVAA